MTFSSKHWKIPGCPTKKEFSLAASLLKSGQKFKIKRAGRWLRFKGWFDFEWDSYTFILFDGKDMIFSCDYNPVAKLYINYRQIASGEVKVLWSKSDVFTVNYPTDLEKDNEIKLWEPGTISLYK